MNESRPTPPWNHWFHCMGHTYGTWLPGDPRGFRTRHHREHVEGDYKNPPPRGLYKERHQQARDLMKRKPVRFTSDQRLVVVRLLVESLQRRSFDVAIACVTDIHFHILARFPDHNPRHWIGVAKKETTYHSGERFTVPLGGLWSARSKSLPIKDRSHQLNTAKYVFNHRKQGGALWYRAKLVSLAPTVGRN